MQPSDLRVALFSGNYNYVRDGANQALNPKETLAAFISAGRILAVGLQHVVLERNGRRPVEFRR